MYSLSQSIISLLSLSLLLHNVAAIDPLFSSCSNSPNYTITDPFAKNLHQLMYQLVIGSPCNGFGLSSVDKQGPNKVNGLALCRGDINSTACKSCLGIANVQIRNLCHFKKQAVISFDECLLRYSDAEFFGEIDQDFTFLLANTQNVSTSPQSEFNAQVMQLMDSLKASRSRRFFAVRETEIIGSSEKLYGLAQCTRDLSTDDCDKCLESAIAQLPGCCGGKRGGRVVGGSCTVRYELYPFYNYNA